MSAIQRKLAAILAADVYQFAWMMGTDETGRSRTTSGTRNVEREDHRRSDHVLVEITPERIAL
jgi:hypothetical protein